MSGENRLFFRSVFGVILVALVFGCNKTGSSDSANAPLTNASQRPVLTPPRGPGPPRQDSGPRGSDDSRQVPEPPNDYLAGNSKFFEQSGIWAISSFTGGCWAEAPTENGFFRFVVFSKNMHNSVNVSIAVADARWSDLPKSRYVEFIGETLDQPDTAARDALSFVELAPELGAGAFKFKWHLESLVNRAVWGRPLVLTPAGGPAAAFPMVGVLEALNRTIDCAQAPEI